MYAQLIDDYLAGPRLVASKVEGLDHAWLDARPIAGQWSIREVICHLSDFEPIYADRMKRVLAETQPTFASGDPSAFAARLAYGNRGLENELAVIQATRQQMAEILQSLPTNEFERTGIHPEAGALTIAELLKRITEHIPHHLRFVEAKCDVLSRRA